jgi:hypothetical protein
LQNIRIVYPQNPIQATRGQKSQNEIVNASVENESQVRLSNIPVITTYSWFPGKKDELVSDAGGTIRIKPGIINSKKRTEYISTFVNFDKMVRETTADPVVRKLLANFKLTEYVLPVEIVASVFYVSVPEKSIEQKSNDSRLQKEITSLLINDGFGIAPEPGQSGFVITIEAITSKGSEVTKEETLRLQHIFTYYSNHAHIEGPVMRGLSYGHIKNLMTIPIGARFTIELSPTGTFLLRAVEPVIA